MQLFGDNPAQVTKCIQRELAYVLAFIGLAAHVAAQCPIRGEGRIRAV